MSEYVVIAIAATYMAMCALVRMGGCGWPWGCA